MRLAAEFMGRCTAVRRGSPLIGLFNIDPRKTRGVPETLYKTRIRFEQGTGKLKPFKLCQALPKNGTSYQALVEPPPAWPCLMTSKVTHPERLSTQVANRMTNTLEGCG